MSEKVTSRAHAVTLLDQFDKNRVRLSILYEHYFHSRKVLARYRPEVTHLVQEVIRLRGYLDYILNSLFRGNYHSADTTLKNTLRLGTYEILFRDHVPDFAAVDEAVKFIKKRRGKGPAGLTNAILRRVRTLVDSIPDRVSSKAPIGESAAMLSHPEWLFKRWVDSFGWDRAKQLCEWNNQIPTMSIRMNSLKTNHSHFEDFLTQETSEWRQDNYFPEFYLISQAYKLRDSKQFREGHFSFQDISSGFIAALLHPSENDTILDVCAAPGGKASALAESMRNRGTIYAFDVDERRITLLKDTVKRLGLNSISCEKKDATRDNFPKAIQILVDAPCTGTGVMGKRADLKWRRKRTDIDEMALLQTKILSHCINYLEPGGELIYATCSLEREENWGVIDNFLLEHSDVSLLSAESRIPEKFADDRGALSTFPPEHGIDGVFGVILKLRE